MEELDLGRLLKGREFINVATTSPDAKPNCAPKMILEAKEREICLVDYTIGRTLENLRRDKRVSLSFMDLDNLTGYQLNGTVGLLDKGPEFDRRSAEFQRRTLQLSASRVIEGARTGKHYEHFELEIPERLVFYQVAVEEIVRIGLHGEIERLSS